MSHPVEAGGGLRLRPRYDGANIRTWIGFRQFMLLAEEAVVQWFRDRGLGPQRLYHEQGLGLDVVDSSVLLPALLEVDDEVVAEVVEQAPGRLAVTLRVARPAGERVVMRARVRVALVRERAAPGDGVVPAPIAPLVVAGSAAGADARRVPLEPGEDAASALARAEPRAFLWSWRAPYYYCHFTERVQHSGYVRALEEVVDRFLADRGLSVRTVLAGRGWIPVVSRARVGLGAVARMEETIHTAFVVEDVMRRAAYEARMDCFVRRGDALVRCATGSILHGYASSDGPDAGRLVELDDATIATLTGGT